MCLCSIYDRATLNYTLAAVDFWSLRVIIGSSSHRSRARGRDKKIGKKEEIYFNLIDSRDKCPSYFSLNVLGFGAKFEPYKIA